MHDSLLQASFNLNNGALSLRFPLYTGSQTYFQAVLPKGRSMIEYILKNYMEDTKPLLKMVIEGGRGDLEADYPPNASSLDSAIKYLSLSHVKTLITQSTVVAE